MMKRGWTVIALVLMTGVIILAVFLKVYSNWGRTLIYEGIIKNVATGFGMVYFEYPDMFSLVGKDYKETLVEAKDLDKYKKEDYRLTYIPSQSALVYSVGHFVGWENIQNSKDKYLLLDDTNNGTTKYRIVLERNPLAISKSWREVNLGVENVGFLNNKKYEISIFEGSLSNLGFPKLQQLMKRGDIVIIFPRRIASDWNATDEFDNFLTETLVVRRAFGLDELKFELLF